MKRTIFLTGATGSMGGAALKELLNRKNESVIRLLVRPGNNNRKKMKKYSSNPKVEIIFGDLTSYSDVKKCIDGVDIVLHPAAFIAPAADHDPETAWKINVGSVDNIIKAIKAQPDPDHIKFIYIGSVAQTGDRLPPIHVGRTGDPLKPSIYDMYACSKIAAERLVAESGLKQWVSLRQTFIAITNTPQDPIMFHQPLNTCLEFCTAKNSGLLLANICDRELNDDFWQRFYNIGGGERSRLTYIELFEKILPATGIKDYRKVFDKNWFALRNFHCHWFEDSGILNNYLEFQEEGIDEYIALIKKETPLIQRIAASLTPKSIIKSKVFKPMAEDAKDCSVYWVKKGMKQRISAFFKTTEEWNQINDWDNEQTVKPTMENYIRLNHGYDEKIPQTELNIADMQQAATFRGGKCLSVKMTKGDLFSPLDWQCARGHQFKATPNIILKGGHWCPECAPPGWDYDEEAKINPFFAQVWYPNHDATESNQYTADCYKDILEKN